MPRLITIVGPIAAGKNTISHLLAARCVEAGRTVVVADVDDVAFMGKPGGNGVNLGPATHRSEC